MKKSLLFVAAMFAAVCANAQGSWTNVVPDGAATDDVVYTAGAVESAKVPGLKITFGGATDWAVKGASTETFTGPDGVEYTKGYIQGGTNGMGSLNVDESNALIEGDYKSAPGLVHSTGESSHIQIVAEQAGTVYVAAKYGKNKCIFLAKVPDADLEELVMEDMSSYIVTYKGLYIKADGTYGATVAEETDTYAALPIAVEPGNTYFFWVAGSKLMLSGINYVTGATGIENVKAAKNVEGVAYNLAGQKVSNSFKGIVIKNGVKFLNK